MVQLKKSNDYINKLKAVKGTNVMLSDSMAQAVFHEALKDPLDGIRTYTLETIERMPEKYSWDKKFKDEIIFLAINDKSNKVRAAAFDVLGKWKIGTIQQEMIAALSDSSYMVAGAALEALATINKDSAYVFSKQMLLQDPKAELEDAAWSIVAARGKRSDMDLFEKRASYVYGTQKVIMGTYIGEYLKNTNDVAVFEKGLGIIKELAAKENIKTYRYAIGSVVFTTRDYYDEQIRTATSKEQVEDYRNRKRLAEKYQQMILDEEKDPDNITKYKKLL